MGGLFLFWFGGGALDDEVVVDAKGAGGRVCLHSGDGGVHLVEDYAVEGDVSAVHNDMDGMVADRWRVGDAACGESDSGSRADGAADVALVSVIFAQRGLGVDAVVDGGADAVVHRGVGKNLDLVIDRVDARDVLDGVFRVTFESGTGGVAFEDERFTVDAEGEPVEDSVGGEAGEFFLDLLNDADGVFLRPGGAGGGFLGEDGWSRKGEDKRCSKSRKHAAG